MNLFKVIAIKTAHYHLQATAQEQLALSLYANHEAGFKSGLYDLNVGVCFKFKAALNTEALITAFQTTLNILFHHHPELRSKFYESRKYFHTSETATLPQVQRRKMEVGEISGGQTPIFVGIYTESERTVLEMKVDHTYVDGGTGFQLSRTILDMAFNLYAQKEGLVGQNTWMGSLKSWAAKQWILGTKEHYQKQKPPREISDKSPVIQYAKRQEAILKSEAFSAYKKNLKPIIDPALNLSNLKAVRVSFNPEEALKAFEYNESTKTFLIPQTFIQKAAERHGIPESLLIKFALQLALSKLTGNHEDFLCRGPRAQTLRDPDSGKKRGAMYAGYTAVSRGEILPSQNGEVPLNELKAHSGKQLNTFITPIEVDKKPVSVPDFIPIETIVKSIYEETHPIPLGINIIPKSSSGALDALKQITGDFDYSYSLGNWPEYAVCVDCQVGQNDTHYMLEITTNKEVDDKLKTLMGIVFMDIIASFVFEDKTIKVKEIRIDGTGMARLKEQDTKDQEKKAKDIQQRNHRTYILALTSLLIRLNLFTPKK